MTASEGLPPHLRPGLPLSDRLLPMSLAVVGARFPNADGSDRRPEIAACTPGEPVELLPEPTNRFDPLAIAVFSGRGVQIGYLPAERASRIGALMGQGREVRAVFQAAADFGAWVRVAFDGEEPTLPPQRERPAPEPEFYPDEEYPDDWGA